DAPVSQYTSKSIFDDCMNSTAFVDVLKQVTDLPEIERIAIQATRFRPGHFATFSGATRASDPSRKQRASFYMPLTPERESDWGGITEFRNADSLTTEGFSPGFNTLDVYAYPQGHWISLVAPFATGERLGLLGRVYASKKSLSDSQG